MQTPNSLVTLNVQIHFHYVTQIITNAQMIVLGWELALMGNAIVDWDFQEMIAQESF